MKSRVRASDGVMLAAEAHGDGLPVVLSCALNTTSENWRPQVEPLVAAGARVVLWDFRGHGRSDAPEDPAAYSMDQVVDDLGHVLDWAAPGQVAVLGGLSFGGLASLHFTLRHPDRVCGLLLFGSGPGFKKPEAQARWEAQVEKTASFIESRGLEGFVSRATEMAVGRRPHGPAAEAAVQAIVAQSPHGLANFARRVAGPAEPVIDRLGEIRVPALVLVGEQDDAYQRAAQVMATRLPEAESVTIPAAGHIVNIEKPEAFNAAVVRFLERLRAGADAGGRPPLPPGG